MREDLPEGMFKEIEDSGRGERNMQRTQSLALRFRNLLRVEPEKILARILFICLFLSVKYGIYLV